MDRVFARWDWGLTLRMTDCPWLGVHRLAMYVCMYVCTTQANISKVGICGVCM